MFFRAALDTSIRIALSTMLVIEDMWPERLPIECTVFHICENGPRFMLEAAPYVKPLVKLKGELPHDYYYGTITESASVVLCEAEAHEKFFDYPENRAKLATHLHNLLAKSKAQQQEQGVSLNETKHRKGLGRLDARIVASLSTFILCASCYVSYWRLL